MSDRLTVAADSDLLTALSGGLAGWSRKVIRQRLQGGCVLVNDEVAHHASRPVLAGDQVVVLPVGQGRAKQYQGLTILFQDNALVAIDKPPGLLSVSAARQGKRHALGLLREQLTVGRKPATLFAVHRLDQETSGVLLFAKSAEMKKAVQAEWGATKKHYLALVEGKLVQGQGTITEPLRMDRKGFRAIVGDHAQAKFAITHFEVRQRYRHRTLVQIALETGRQHQIRAHFSWLGHPVVGDRRYGDPDLCLALHAERLILPHPLSGERLRIEAPLPKDFAKLLKKLHP